MKIKSGSLILISILEKYLRIWKNFFFLNRKFPKNFVLLSSGLLYYNAMHRNLQVEEKRDEGGEAGGIARIINPRE